MFKRGSALGYLLPFSGLRTWNYNPGGIYQAEKFKNARTRVVAWHHTRLFERDNKTCRADNMTLPYARCRCGEDSWTHHGNLRFESRLYRWTGFRRGDWHFTCNAAK